MKPIAAPARSTSTPCDGTWQADPGFGIYVHIPFCLHRCNYCDFNTYESMDRLHGPYVDALVKDIERNPDTDRRVTSIFFGGGTPTLLAPAQLGRVLAAIRTTFDVEPGAEITVEANPETVDAKAFEELLDAGFNRVSIGVQSLDSQVLVRLGRTHSADVALDAIRAAREAGVESVNADLIYGSPWETKRHGVRRSRGSWPSRPNTCLRTPLPSRKGLHWPPSLRVVAPLMSI